MAALMQKTCVPCLPQRSALPLAVRPRAARAVAVRATAGQDQAAEVVRAVALISAASTLLMADSASAAVELSQLAAGDNRVGTIATLLVPVLGWVGFNIGQPFLTQLGRMGEMEAEASAPAKPAARKAAIRRSVATAVGLSAALMLVADSASAATELGQLAETDNRILVLATVFVPVVGWVGFNIFQPLFNQFTRMAGKVEGSAPVKKAAAAPKKAAAAVKKAVAPPAKKAVAAVKAAAPAGNPFGGLFKGKASVAASVGLAAAALLVADSASAATELSQLAETDNRVLVLATVFVPVVGWVGFNIFQPLFNQFTRMAGKVEGDAPVKKAAAAPKKAAAAVKKAVAPPAKKAVAAVKKAAAPAGGNPFSGLFKK